MGLDCREVMAGSADRDEMEPARKIVGVLIDRSAIRTGSGGVRVVSGEHRGMTPLARTDQADEIRRLGIPLGKRCFEAKAGASRRSGMQTTQIAA